jgi:2-polyprenyl-3-methyl-5-hydroxy-6-metoxy-1,4-benzoquinol methylase
MSLPALNSRYVVTANRLEKALKIRAVISDFIQKPVEGLSLLDVGVGTGEIIDHFAQNNQTHGVDIQDQRASKVSAFQLVKDERLPFADRVFDVVISNHVIEHVRSPQLHLQEIARVLKPNGIVYLATPNRFFPKETHFKLYLLHYFSAAVYFYLAAKLGRRGERFWMFTPYGLRRVAINCGFRLKDYTGLILAHPERFNAKAVCPMGTGKFIGQMLRWISPTLICILQPTVKRIQ